MTSSELLGLLNYKNEAKACAPALLPASLITHVSVVSG